MELLYFERKRGVPRDYRAPINVPSGHFDGVLRAGEVLVNDVNQANDLSEMGCFGNLLERRQPTVAARCFGVNAELFKTISRTNANDSTNWVKLESAGKAVRLAAIEKLNETYEKAPQSNSCSMEPVSSKQKPNKGMRLRQQSSSELASGVADLVQESVNECENMDSAIEENMNKQVNKTDANLVANAVKNEAEAEAKCSVNGECLRHMELWASMVCKDRALHLGMEESMYLVHDLAVLQVSINNIPLSSNELWRRFYAIAGLTFIKRYACYRYLRQMGWIVRPGLAYGVDFMIYCDGPDYHHSSAAVRILDSNSSNLINSNENINAHLFSALNRALNNMKKCLILVNVDIPIGLSLDQSVDCVERIRIECTTLAKCRHQDLQV